MRRLFVMALTAAASVWAGIGQWTSLGGPDGGNIAMLAIDPNTADTIYAASNAGSTFKSIDGGTRWTVTDFPIGRLIIDPKDSQTLYVVTPSRGIFKSSDGGATWRDANSGLTGYGSSLAFDPQNPKTLYTGVGLQIFKSADGAERWTAFSLALPPDAREYTLFPGDRSHKIRQRCTRPSRGSLSWTPRDSTGAAMAARTGRAFRPQIT